MPKFRKIQRLIVQDEAYQVQKLLRKVNYADEYHANLAILYYDGGVLSPAGQSRFESISPASASVLAEYAETSTHDCDAAVERSRVLLRLAQILRQSNDEMAIMETRDTGRALSETSTVDIAGGEDRSLNASLAAGNTVVYKPSEYTPAQGTVLAAILTEAGCHPVSSPGQVSTGKKVASSAVQGMKYVTMELGGKSSLIVPPDGDI
ncbi:betaine aldehyde dehydrogenase [Fusarium globosum]|uniref:aldehyde dehydrogenase (NAD(+)) n=1 Tax=Fusarium globosum TaxID=78864 RepID=A0A8H6D0V1_9HYPO|nr:betaine aldehyde dehydrogenase [Fusarium globosum]